jgi:hypothetical protein
MAFGVARRLIDPAVLRTGCIARLTDFDKKPRRKLTAPSLLVACDAQPLPWLDEALGDQLLVLPPSLQLDRALSSAQRHHT